ncbi:MAG TPA: helix-turn-helix domain-containing protein [Sphingomonas sp.]|uniref:winged helix-turn-helix transcriptional regulator n=1 Tax=Sphingomonas sp. TaxID=28214 RepID=UPI002C1416F1|nr:helix-turn-helix domain-containing protein [Sphingomonas sp.]HMI18722.1 helix-turn-helix domain-containing protein [Sphingomonas sp.]
MDNEKYASGTCPVGRGASRVPDLWSIMILRDAALGHTRFDQFRKSLGIAPNILTRRLAALVEDGLLEKSRYSERPPRDEYVLTSCGRDYLPVLQAIAAWGTKHFGGGPLSTTFDADTGQKIEPVVIDRVTGKPLSEMKLRVEQPG